MQITLVILIVASGARDLFGYSELHAAASRGDSRLLRSLLSDDSNSSDVNGKTVDGGYTPLHLAASAGHAGCVKELLKCHKIDINLTDAFGRTPLEAAEENFKNNVAKLLRNYGRCRNYDWCLYMIGSINCMPCITYIAEFEIAVGHWPFSDQFQDLTNQN